MSSWRRKRFWSSVEVGPVEGGYGVCLDGRPMRTPAKAPLVVPVHALARAIADEWQMQQAEIEPHTMPLTRAANSAIDKVNVERDAVLRIVADYGQTDLVCHRAPAPRELVARQALAWDPLIDWADAALGAPLRTTVGVMPVEQPAASLATLLGHLQPLDSFELTAMHDLVAISGSLVIGLAVMEGFATPQDLWERSRIDDAWQAEQWGVDCEAARLAESRRSAFMDAFRFLRLSRES